MAAAVGLDDGGLQERGDAAELVEDGAAGGLGGVRGEDGADVEVLDGLAQVLGVGVLEPVGGAGEEAALGGAPGAQLAAAVDLLGDVGQVEVGGEGADELGGGLQVGAAAAARRRPRRRCGSGARTRSTRSRSSGPPGGRGSRRAGRPGGGCRRAARCWRSWSGRRHCSQVRLLAVLKLVREGYSARARRRGRCAGPASGQESERTALSDRLQDRCPLRRDVPPWLAGLVCLGRCAVTALPYLRCRRLRNRRIAVRLPPRLAAPATLLYPRPHRGRP